MILPPLEYRKITAPYYRIGVFEYWGDIYESTFCYLKPFLKVKDGSDLFNSISDLDVYFNYELLVENTTPLTWSDMLQLTGIKTLGQLRNAMFRSSLLRDICEKEKIIQPYEDDFSPHQLESLLPKLLKLGHKKIRCIPQWPEIDKPVVIDLEVREIIHKYNQNRCLQTLDETLFFGNAFDFVETYICGSKEQVEFFAKDLEGFMCNEKTRTNWQDD